jgi:CheY-like chemotaxis protein
MILRLPTTSVVEVLLVEDNEDDVELTCNGFRRCKMLANLHQVKDGEECMAFLRKQGAFADAPRPDLILLDLNMPRMDGREVLAEIVADETLNSIPVVVLTTSADEGEILNMYRLRCSSYIVKPVNFEKFMDVVHFIAEYWFKVVVLPTGDPSGQAGPACPSPSEAY